MTDERWLKVINKSNNRQRFLLLDKFSKKEIKAEAKEMQPLNEKYRHSPDNLIRYFREFSERWLHFRFLSAMMYDLPILIDLSYEHLMNDKRILSFQNQFNSAYLILGYSKNPFHLLCCNASEDSKIKQHLSGIKYFVSTTEKSYLDLYPRNKLVYLSPCSQNMLEKFDHNLVYIVGGYSMQEESPCMEVVKKRHVKTARFPIELRNRKNYNFNLDDVLELLLMLKMNKSWGHIVGEFYRTHPNYIRGIKMDYLPDIKAAVHTDFPDVKTNIDKKLKENGAKWENNIRKYN